MKLLNDDFLTTVSGGKKSSKKEESLASMSLDLLRECAFLVCDVATKIVPPVVFIANLVKYISGERNSEKFLKDPLKECYNTATWSNVQKNSK